jgi:hypothetical protein
VTTKRRVLIAVGAALFFGLVLGIRYCAPRVEYQPPPGKKPPAGVKPDEKPAAANSGGNAKDAAEPRSALADALNAPNADIRADLKVLAEIFDAYRSNLRANPIGSNAEITAALTGKNQLKLALVPPDHAAINASGELCDRWGQPFFFHQVSGTQMEIRSAGPDKKMWNDDDVVFTP